MAREGDVEYRVLTVSREFGSGGGRIAKTIAERLGWKLLDSALIEAVASAAQVDPNLVQHYDEHVDGWLQRINRQAIRGAALSGGLAFDRSSYFDEENMKSVTCQLIEQAYKDGDCVIVGRGAQCILRNKPLAFRVFVYAPFQTRVHRLRTRLDPGVDIPRRIVEVYTARAHFLQKRFGAAWNDPHLYNLMISSHEDEDLTAKVILYAMTVRQQVAPIAPRIG